MQFPTIQKSSTGTLTIFRIIVIILIITVSSSLGRKRFGLRGHTSWIVPKEADSIALDMFDRWIGFAYERHLDSTVIPREQISLDLPFPTYLVHDSLEDKILSDPNPAKYAFGLTYNYPAVMGDSVLGSLSVRYVPFTGKYKGAGVRVGSDFSESHAARILARRDISRLLGLIRILKLNGGASRFACLDTTNTFVWIDATPYELAVKHKQIITRADIVAIGRPREVNYRAYGISEYGDTTNKEPWRSRFFDSARLELEKVLKGRIESKQLLIFFPSSYSEDERNDPHPSPVVEKSKRMIWTIDQVDFHFLPYFYLQSQDNIIPIQYLEEVVSYLPDSSYNVGAIRNALAVKDSREKDRLTIATEAITGDHAGTIAFVLGTLSDYAGRQYRANYPLVEHFYPGEGAIVEAVLPIYERALEERDLPSTITIERDNNHYHLYSEDLSNLINAFYDILLTSEERGHGRLNESLFDNVSREVMLEFIAGAYTRYGDAWTIRGANMSQKGRLLKRFFEKLGCPADHSWRAGRIPVPHTVSFLPTEEVVKHLSKTATFQGDWLLGPVVDRIDDRHLEFICSNGGYKLYYPSVWTLHTDSVGNLSHFTSDEEERIGFHIRPAPIALGTSLDSVFVNYWERFQEANWIYSLKHRRKGFLGRREAIEVPRMDFKGSLFIFDFDGRVFLAELTWTQDRPNSIYRHVLSSIRPK